MDTIEQQTACKACGKPLTTTRGHRQRQYCDDVCKMRYSRRKAQPSDGVTIVTNDAMLQARVTELEEKLDLAERGSEQVQQAFQQYVRMTNDRVSELVGEVVKYRQADERDLKRRKIEELEQESATSKARIEELEQRVKELSARLALEDAYRYDTQERPFKPWLKKNPHARDTAEVFKRILADTRLPHHGSRSLYEARLKLYGYSAEEVSLFQAVWTDMLFMQG